ncbi:unnamed protein product [Amoebophrya sp. A25]|nr:unnamed protein product [Amoebophrya sp. A25]|eukprot:GSA25T00004789001.1
MRQSQSHVTLTSKQKMSHFSPFADFTSLYDLGPQNFYFAASADGIAWFQTRGGHSANAGPSIFHKHDRGKTEDGGIDLYCSDLIPPGGGTGVVGQPRTCSFPRRILSGLHLAHGPPVWTSDGGLAAAADGQLFLFQGEQGNVNLVEGTSTTTSFETSTTLPTILSFPGFDFVSSQCCLAADRDGRLVFALRRKRSDGRSSTTATTDVIVVLDPRPIFAAVAAESRQARDEENGDDSTISLETLQRYLPIQRSRRRTSASSSLYAVISTSAVESQYAFDLLLDLVPQLSASQSLFCFEFGEHEEIDCVDLCAPPGPDSSPGERQSLSASNRTHNWRALCVVREPNGFSARMAVFENALASVVENEGSQSPSRGSISPTKSAKNDNSSPQKRMISTNDTAGGGSCAIDSVYASLANGDYSVLLEEPTVIRENLDLFGCRKDMFSQAVLLESGSSNSRSGSTSSSSANADSSKKCLQYCEYARPSAKWLGPAKIAVLMTVDDKYGMYTSGVFPFVFFEPKWRSQSSYMRSLDTFSGDSLQSAWKVTRLASAYATSSAVDMHQVCASVGGPSGLLDGSSGGGYSQASTWTTASSGNVGVLSAGTGIPLGGGLSSRALKTAKDMRSSAFPNPWNYTYKNVVPELFGEFEANSFVVYQDAQGVWHAILSRAGSAGKLPKNAQTAVCPDDARFHDELWTLNFDRSLTIRIPGTKDLIGAVVPLFAEPSAADNPANSSPKSRRGSGHLASTGFVSPPGQQQLPGMVATSPQHALSPQKTAANGPGGNMAESGMILLFHSSPYHSGDVYCVCNSTNTGAANFVPTYRLTSLGRRTVHKVSVPRCLSIPAPSRDGERVPCLVYLPETVECIKEGVTRTSSGTLEETASPSSKSRSQRLPKREYPVVLWLHGGPNSHFRFDWLPTSPNAFGFSTLARTWGPAHLGPWLAQHGFIVVMPNFVGGTRYGLRRFLASWGAKRFGTADREEILDIGRYFRTRQAAVDVFGDAGCAEQSFSRAIGLMGRSCGGYLTLRCAQHREITATGAFTSSGSGEKVATTQGGSFRAFPSVFQCALAFCPITNWILTNSTSGDPRDAALMSGFLSASSCQPLAATRQAALAISPAFSDVPLQMPLMLLHGTNDKVVSWKNADEFEEKVLATHKGGYRAYKFDPGAKSGGSHLTLERETFASKGLLSLSSEQQGGGSNPSAGAKSPSRGAGGPMHLQAGFTPTDEAPAVIIRVEGEDHSLVSSEAWCRQLPELILGFLKEHLLPWEYPNQPGGFAMEALFRGG